jgi:hypothetical protein
MCRPSDFPPYEPAAEEAPEVTSTLASALYATAGVGWQRSMRDVPVRVLRQGGAIVIELTVLEEELGLTLVLSPAEAGAIAAGLERAAGVKP